MLHSSSCWRGLTGVAGTRVGRRRLDEVGLGCSAGVLLVVGGIGVELREWRLEGVDCVPWPRSRLPTASLLLDSGLAECM